MSRRSRDRAADALRVLIPALLEANSVWMTKYANENPAGLAAFPSPLHGYTAGPQNVAGRMLQNYGPYAPYAAFAAPPLTETFLPYWRRTF